MKRAALAACVAALVAPSSAHAARFAVGLEPGATPDAIERAICVRADRELLPLGAVVVEAPSAKALREAPGVAWVERLTPRRLAFTPSDPMYPRQWHLHYDRAFDFWPEIPLLIPIRVAIIDSGIDGGHPEFAGKVVAHRSFVGGSALTDQQGHGTFVAGIVAAQTNNAAGIAGMAPAAQLVVAKVVGRGKEVSLEAEAKAIRWAVDRGARVINLSLGGLRDPRDKNRDTFSPLEAAAVKYAYSRHVLVVAAVGNADQAPRSPWPYASYPAALPHVLGVSAIGRAGSTPTFSNRDPVYNDVAAPGQEILSTFPRQLTAQRPSCAEQGFSSCGPDEYRHAEGTSFAAPQVAAAAALMLGVNPLLRPDQVRSLIERTADDLSPLTGCPRCPPGRDELSGWGRLNVQRALTGVAAPPAPDRFETNDDAGAEAFKLYGARNSITATVDFWDDQTDVYRVHLRARQRVTAWLDGPYKANSTLVLWRPGTTQLGGPPSLRLLQNRAAASAKRGWRQRVQYRARKTGWHYLEVKVISANAGPYRLTFSKR